MEVLDDPAFLPFFAGGLIAASWSDIRHRKVPNALNLTIGVVGALFQIVRFGVDGLVGAALGFLAAFALVIIPFAIRLHRGGDAKLVLALGIWLGPRLAFWAYVWGIAVGGLVAIGVMIAAGPDTRRRIVRNLKMAAATVTMPVVDDDRPARFHVPMALAFSVGTIVAIAID